MTWVVMVLVTLCAAVAQTLMPPVIWMGGAKPPVLLAVVLYYALHRDAGEVYIAALLCGVVQDSLSPVTLGYSPVLFCLLGWVVSRFRRVVLSETLLAPVVFGLAAGCLCTVLMYVLLARQGQVDWPWMRMLWRSAGTGLLGAIATPFVFVLTGGLDRLVGNVAMRETIDDYE